MVYYESLESCSIHVNLSETKIEKAKLHSSEILMLVICMKTMLITPTHIATVYACTTTNVLPEILVVDKFPYNPPSKIFDLGRLF